MAHHINVSATTDKPSLTRHMKRVLEEHGEFTVSAASGEPVSRMEWAIAALHGFFPGYVVSHSSIEHVAGKTEGEISLITKRVWVQEEDKHGREAQEDTNTAESGQPRQGR